MTDKLLLSVTEIGGYPDFTPLYESLGYTVRHETAMRKALKLLKKESPDVIVAEFNFQSDFRDRTRRALPVRRHHYLPYRHIIVDDDPAVRSYNSFPAVIHSPSSASNIKTINKKIIYFIHEIL